jgi:hypothetical protein
MTVPTTAIHILRLLLQADQNLCGLQKDMRNNAIQWKDQAQAQAVPVLTLASFMDGAAVAYQTRLQWLDDAQANAPLWAELSAMWQMLGGTGQDFSDVTTPLRAVADQLGPAAKTTYAQIVGVCDQIIAAINAPVSLWPE